MEKRYRLEYGSPEIGHIFEVLEVEGIISRMLSSKNLIYVGCELEFEPDTGNHTYLVLKGLESDITTAEKRLGLAKDIGNRAGIERTFECVEGLDVEDARPERDPNLVYNE